MKAKPIGGLADPRAGTSPSLGASTNGAGVVLLCTEDPVFAALCKRALEGAQHAQSVVAVSPPELLAAARQVAHDVLVLDADRQEIPACKALAGKAMLLSDAPVVLISAYLAPGSPGLGTLLQSIPAHFVQKPQGSSSLSLAAEDGPSFVAALQSAFTAHLAQDFGAEAAEDTDGAGHG